MDGKRIALVTVVTCLMFCVAIAAQKTGLTTTWSNPPSVEGFTNLQGALSNSGEGGNPGGFLKGTRKGGVNVSFCPAPYLRDNWGDLFGTGPGTISFDVKALDDYTIPYINFFFSDGGSTFRYMIRTQKVLKHSQAKADGWVRYSIPWQATWDRAQAEAKGWRPNRKTAKWSKVVNNPRHSCLVINGVSSEGDQTVGIDNFCVDAGKVVEPAPPQEK